MSGGLTMPAMSVSMSDPRLRRQWMAQAKAGSAAAFEQILEAHAGVVLRTAQRLLLNDTDAQDASQEVFVRLYQTLGTFDTERELMPWLYRMTVNICHDFRRKRLPFVSLTDVPEPVAPGVTAEQQLTLMERKRLLNEALATLSVREREAIVLRDLEGLTTAETAAALESSEATVRSQISVGRAKLRLYLTRKGQPR